MSKSTDIFNEIPDLNYHETEIKVNALEFEKVVNARRSVRVYTAEKIPDSVVEKCLDLALLAPNSSNLQPWEFYWVETQEKKKQLQFACFSQPAASTANTLIVAVAKTKTWNKNRLQMLDFFQKSGEKIPRSALAYYEKLAPFMYKQGLFGPLKKIIFFIRGLSTPSPRNPTSFSDMRVWAAKSTALACENLMLAFSSFGYDTCPMEGFDEVRVKKILNLGCHSEITMIISAGKRDKKGVYGPRIRFPKEQFVFKV